TFVCVRHGDNQRFLANTDCPVQLLLPYLRRKAGVPAGGELPVGPFCSGLLFQAKLQSERASKFLPAPGTYYVCCVEFGAPGGCPRQAGTRTPPQPPRSRPAGVPVVPGALRRVRRGSAAGMQQEHVYQALVLLLKDPSPELTGQ
uniref:Uncharacterized protein n=1 Tax=Apteryx owenii TaxID=8824 RepID=A0A8B9QNE5_APTOW